MNEGVHSTSELFEHLSFLNVSWEVSKDKSFSSGVSNSQKFECKSIFNLLIDVSCVNHFLSLQEERMFVFITASEIRDVLVYVIHGDDWQSHINTKSLNKLILETVRGSEEHDLGCCWPSFKELV